MSILAQHQSRLRWLFVVFFCMAFQNGFFWQTLVPTQGHPQKLPAQHAVGH